MEGIDRGVEGVECEWGVGDVGGERCGRCGGDKVWEV